LVVNLESNREEKPRGTFDSKGNLDWGSNKRKTGRCVMEEIARRRENSDGWAEQDSLCITGEKKVHTGVSRAGGRRSVMKNTPKRKGLTFPSTWRG